MKVYRVISNMEREKEYYMKSLITLNTSRSTNYGEGENTFFGDCIDKKFFFLYAEDAYKYCTYQYAIRHGENIFEESLVSYIAEYDIPEELLRGSVGLGLYSYDRGYRGYTVINYMAIEFAIDFYKIAIDEFDKFEVWNLHQMMKDKFISSTNNFITGRIYPGNYTDDFEKDVYPLIPSELLRQSYLTKSKLFIDNFKNYGYTCWSGNGQRVFIPGTREGFGYENYSDFLQFLSIEDYIIEKNITKKLVIN